MLVKIAGINQELDFADGSVTNFVTLLLPNGTPVKAVVSDDGARQVIEARAAEGGLQPPTPAPPQPHYPPPPPAAPPQEHFASAELETDEDGVVVFGGGSPVSSSPQNAPTTMWMPPAEEQAPGPPPPAQAAPYQHTDATVQQRLYQKHQTELREKAKRGPSIGRTVPKDDRGYPIVPGSAGGVDPHDVVGSGAGANGVDEDGVGQF